LTNIKVHSWQSNSVLDLAEIAASILSVPTGSNIYLLQGEMGAGKTTLTGGMIAFLGSENQVQSPTYGLVHEYETKGGPVYHFDFYRIKTDEEAMDIGFEEYLDNGNYCFIEWSEKIVRLLPEMYNTISILIEENQSRRITLATYQSGKSVS